MQLILVFFSVETSIKMASNCTWSVCAICDSLRQSKPSVYWCSECDQGLCYNCSERHSVPNATNNHHTVPIDTYRLLPENIMRTTQTCPDHNTLYQTCCYQHECLCCIKCDLKAHRGFTNVQNIVDVVDNIKKSHVFLECEETLTDFISNVENIIKNREDNALSLQKQRQIIQNEVKSIRQNVNDYLNTMES